MEAISLARGRQAILEDAIVLKYLPPDLINIIRHEKCPRFLDAIAAGSLIPNLTLRFFARFENIFADICSRWVFGRRNENEYRSIIEAFARILPFAPYLSVYLQRYCSSTESDSNKASNHPTIALLASVFDQLLALADVDIQRILLAVQRLLDFDLHTFGSTISSIKINSLLDHPKLPVRYLACRILSSLYSTSDAKWEDMIQYYVGKDRIAKGDFDGDSIDYAFLTLFEEKRLRLGETLQKELSMASYSNAPKFSLEGLSTYVVDFGKVLLPRINGLPNRTSNLVATSTTQENMEKLAKSFLGSSPILLYGRSGSGKTALVNNLARELAMDSTIVVLHLNEQTDAKTLIGMYTAGSTPGSFIWRAGVLTRAVREGRWVFIEDFDRAPNEVISVILPLVERGELFIPSRNETIKAASGFRLFASIRTYLNANGTENPPSPHVLGARLWSRVPVRMPNEDEFRQIIEKKYSILHKFVPGIIAVYHRICTLTQKSSFAAQNRSSTLRPVGPRDLLKWCRRMEAILLGAGCKTGSEPVDEVLIYELFMEAADCFAGSLQAESARSILIYAIAEEMNIPPQRAEHFTNAHIPRYDESDQQLSIGRVALKKRSFKNRVSKTSNKSRPFASTSHTKRLLEQVGVAIKMSEPVLLVGETGIGKTTVVQQLADSLGFKLTAINLSQQSEVGDLLGGFKPVNVRNLAIPLKEEFDDLFASTGISVSRNQRYLEQLGKCVAKGQWARASKLWHEAPRMFEKILSDHLRLDVKEPRSTTEQPLKRRKTESKISALRQLKPRWDRFSQTLQQFDAQLAGGSKGFAFTFVEGNLVRAARNGEWVLLDEINLASPDTLESIADLLHSGSDDAPSLLLSDTGEIERVKAHVNFRIFGSMNPATDVGKRDLPAGLRSRFSEIYVDSPDRNSDDLLSIVKAYLKDFVSSDERAASDISKLYTNTKRMAEEKRLVDGANQIPHFSLRTLTRVLSYVTEIAPSYGLRRALYEGFAMGFLTLLDRESERTLQPLIDHYLLDSHSNPRALLAQQPKLPSDGKQYVRFMNKKRDRQYWMRQGREKPQEQAHYIITPFVERNMLNLVRATSTRRFPILIQGPTSSGKTSMIEYLANFSGNKFVRINNHEHTDLQEYLGTYISDSSGQLRFQEGLLVQALREGYWIVLDELNLAPSDVLEALNRLLDDNRELLIPETQEVVRPHENFMLFATQNPAGLYGGRKALSRAFRNRFLELHFDDIPEDELEYILERRSQNIAPSDCRRIVSVYKELSRLRQSNRLFEQKDSFATLRDLFRWASRNAENREELAANGYMLLGERVRKAEERMAVKGVIENVMKVKLDPDSLYQLDSTPEFKLFDTSGNAHGVVWTRAMRRLYILVAHALRNNEPVLLVGETGCGKTTVCQMLAEAFHKNLHSVNAHQNTETGDLIGAQRPVRNRAAILQQLMSDLKAALQQPDDEIENLLDQYRSLNVDQLEKISPHLHDRIEVNQVKSKALFEWCDGSLVQAMKEGQFFLLDEISLAEDSVLERLNSVLESHRTLLMAEKGVKDSFVQAVDGFQFFATMNPGGDYGKRELSPALRNRFTEIWVPSLSEQEDILQIVESKLEVAAKPYAKAIVNFAQWFEDTYRSYSPTSVSIRDMLAWVTFINFTEAQDVPHAIVQGAAMVYIDTLGANPAALLAISPESIEAERTRCLEQLGIFVSVDALAIYFEPVALSSSDEKLSIGMFSIFKGKESHVEASFAFDAPTTRLNSMRILRSLQVPKPILIEGSPGVGKTTLVSAIAMAVGMPLIRINLSEQTDLMDLFGSDVPVEGAAAGQFAWRDAPFLRAMQNGHWVLLDEMNLASQSVLEGLNACLDHRGEVYISELDQTFKRHPRFTLFAAQNPHHQGGGRKGLPSSFVNRFTVVYADVFRTEDLMLICKHNYPQLSDEMILYVVKYVSKLEEDVNNKRKYGAQGGPWEINLRDTLRWLQLLASPFPFLGGRHPADFLNIIFKQRFRSLKDRREVDAAFIEVFDTQLPLHHLYHNVASDTYQVGMALLPRHPIIQQLQGIISDPRLRLAEIESLMICIQHNLPCILVGPSGSGKSSLLQHVATVLGASYTVFPLNSDIDTMDLIGGYEQMDSRRALGTFLEKLDVFLHLRVVMSLPKIAPPEAIQLLEILRFDDRYTDRFLPKVHDFLLNLEKATGLAELKTFIMECRQLRHESDTVQSARFEWVDGVLVKALESGSWLVLDNANLCSSSVLDRLNSLLEPNGVLSINEYIGSDGEPRSIKPHPNFRLFMTMDPRFGELSRAMRNRSVEIFVDTISSHAEDFLSGKPSDIKRLESATYKFRTLIQSIEARSIPTSNEFMLEPGLDNMSVENLALLFRFESALKDGLLIEPALLSQHKSFLSAFNYQGAVQNGIAMLYDSFTKMEDLSNATKDAQTLHPLQNSPVVYLLQQASDTFTPFWLGTILECQIQIYLATCKYDNQAEALGRIKPVKMNRLQRSLVRKVSPQVGNDSTVNVGNFLSNILVAMNTYLQENTKCDSKWRQRSKVLRSLTQLWLNTFELVSNTAFEEATFQAHLTIATKSLEKLLPSISGNSLMDSLTTTLVQSIRSRLKADFDIGFKLTSGLSMETLWAYLRPAPIVSEDVLSTLLKLEQAASRFDQIRWRSSVSLSSYSKIIRFFAKTYETVFTTSIDSASLLEGISDELGVLEMKSAKGDEETAPYFRNQFELLREHHMLREAIYGHDSNTESMMSSLSDVLVLADYPTSSLMRSTAVQRSKHSIHDIGFILGPRDDCFLTKEDLAICVLGKLQTLGDVQLRSLELLETELPLLGTQLSSSGSELCQDTVKLMVDLLKNMMLGVIAAHGNDYASRFQIWMDTMKSKSETAITFGSDSEGTEASRVDLLGTECPSHLQTVIAEHFEPAILCLLPANTMAYDKLRSLSLAWVHFATGCILLFVPSRPFDPDKRQRLERDQHQELQKSLRLQLASLLEFEGLFTGQSSSLRAELLKEELYDLGEPPAVLQQIYRPKDSELDQLQAEFNNILRMVEDSSPTKIVERLLTTDATTELRPAKTLLVNVLELIQRLSLSFRAYQDITAPVLALLKSLQFGVSAALLASSQNWEESPVISTICRTVPFLGGHPMADCTLPIGADTMAYIEVMRMIIGVQGKTLIRPETSYNLLSAFEKIYQLWSSELQAERDETELKSGIFRFRGSAADEAEIDKDQFDELFPSYDDNEPRPSAERSGHLSAREATTKISTLHESIMLGDQLPGKSLRDAVITFSRYVGQHSNDRQHFNGSSLTANLLPGVVLAVKENIETIQMTSVDATYNFYTSPNLPEIRKLVLLVRQVQHRFRELQEVDEIAHMQPLADVLTSCDELLQFKHTEPLAKIITKTEKIHGHVHEWQFGGWASRVHSVLTIYDSLTSTLVGWRRLELSTWAKLFDMENMKCEEDARAWWFIAYRVTIAVPLSMSDSKSDLSDYAQDLLRDLIAYVETSIQGQFSQRMCILRQMQQHLEMAATTSPNIQIICDALANFIGFFSKHERLVSDNIARGRQSLEKAMKDVLLLASWKDTNIVALRDSAKRSHHKLFKIVRKYRALLGQPMEPIVRGGLPELAKESAIISRVKDITLITVADASAIKWCEEAVPGWNNIGRRYIDMDRTISLMNKMSQLSPTTVDSHESTESFLSDLVDSMSVLQKATPTILNEENKDKVKHLKSRKRKLFAETLKQVRQMGIKFNLGGDILSQQKSLSMVLSKTSRLPISSWLDTAEIEHYFEKMLEILPRAREVTRQHSEDLSSPEIIRSVGLLEGLMFFGINQRHRLKSALNSHMALDDLIAKILPLGARELPNIKLMKHQSNRMEILTWLPNLLRITLELVEMHSQMTEVNHESLKARIEIWLQEAGNLIKIFKSLSRLPDFIISGEHQAFQDSHSHFLETVAAGLQELSRSHPKINFILRQLIPWTLVTSKAREIEPETATISALCDQLRSVGDSMLASIEQLNKILSTYPTSTEDVAWLVKVESCLHSSIAALSCENIVAQMKNTIDILARIDLDKETNSRSATALFSIMLPLFQQYSKVGTSFIEKYALQHRATCKLTYVLAKSFNQIASQGYCTPSEKSESQEGKSEKLEGGTGLGDGEGAEDISKDIQDDENLDDLAQEQNREDKGELENEEDAVDMADGEMEGETGEAEEKGKDDNDSGSEESGNEMDEEADDVDDLDPNAIDEKMWDGDGEKAEKEQEGDESKGKADKDEAAAAQESAKDTNHDDEAEVDEEELAGAEQSEEVKNDEAEKHDSKAEDTEALELPDDMEIGGSDHEGSVGKNDDGIMEDVSDTEDNIPEDENKEGDEHLNESGNEQSDVEEKENEEMDLDIDYLDTEDENMGEKTDDAGEKTDELPEETPEDRDGLLRDQDTNSNADVDNAAPSDVQGIGEAQDDDQADNDNSAQSRAQRDDGGKSGEPSEQKESAAEGGETELRADGEASEQPEKSHDTSAAQPFKKLGDALEKWHRQQTQIKEAAEPQEKKTNQSADVDPNASDFQHLQDENAQADNQALGTATEDQAHTLDESMAIDDENLKELPSTFDTDDVEDNKDDTAEDMEDDEVFNNDDQGTDDPYEGRAGAMIEKSERSAPHETKYSGRVTSEHSDEEDVEDVDNQLSDTHLTDVNEIMASQSASEAREIWASYESATRDLSLSLTEQLRLILAPTMATKMRGDFRSGKRLNIKKIIPYIASQYKRDKIWMRRTVPSKRSYQILLAVDDSRSMGESGSGALAFETLVMVSKSLSMLEVGEIGVVGFGESVRVAHAFDAPFSSDAGPRILRSFEFAQDRTDVTRLVRDSIELFRAARTKAVGGPADLWQLELIISDGVCDSAEHEPIRRLLRTAMEERIMMVFVVVDDVKNKKNGESVMDLKEAKFIKNEFTGASQVKIERYLDTFPFQYYLIVSDVRELPSVLATLLRQWFAEVTDSST